MFRIQIFWLLLLLLPAVLTLNDEARLTKHLLDNYSRVTSVYVRPLVNARDTLEVTHGLSIISLGDVELDSNRMVVNVWENLAWKDEFLQWNPVEYGGVRSIRVPTHQIFTPDIIIYGLERPEERVETLAVVDYTGHVMWIPLVKLHPTCDFAAGNSTDKQCPLQFGSWTYDGRRLNLTMNYDHAHLDLFMPNHQWALLEAKAERRVQKYNCCPEPYIDIKYTLKLRAKDVESGDVIDDGDVSGSHGDDDVDSDVSSDVSSDSSSEDDSS